MNRPSHAHMEALLAHSDWVQDLVTKLVYDPSHADDVLQETWRISVERPPGEAADTKGWLANVARNTSRKLMRGEGRRRKRERAAARPEATPDTVDVIAKAELQKRMVEAVLGLEEPYRTCVLLRFSEDLAPRQIAARLDRPVQTVRSQIARGLAKLRTELDSEYGDRSTWVVAFLPLTRSLQTQAPAVLKVGAGVLSLKWAAVVVAIVAGLIIWKPWDRLLPSDGPQPLPGEVASSGVPDRSNDVDVAALTEGSARRVAATVSATTSPGLQITLVDPATGTPVTEVPWWILRTGAFDTSDSDDETQTQSPLHQGVTGDDGVVQFALPADSLVQLRTERTGRFARGSWGLVTQDEKERRRTLPLDPGHTLTGRVVDGAGQPLKGVELVRRRFDFTTELIGVTDEMGVFHAHRMASLPRRFVIDELGKVIATATHPEIGQPSSDTGPVRARPKWSQWRVWETPRGVPGVPGVPRVPGASDPIDVGDIIMERTGVLTGTVVDARGAPVEGALVSRRRDRILPVMGELLWTHPIPLPWDAGGEVLPGDVLTDALGQFSIALKYEAPSDSRVMAVSPQGGRAIAERPILGPDQTWAPIEIELLLGRAFELRLVDAAHPETGLWSWDNKPPIATLRPHPAGSAWGVQLTQLTVPKNGLLHIRRPFLGTDRATVSVLLDGYDPAEFEIDLAQPGCTVELVRQPQMHINVAVIGPGGERADAVNIMVSALAPLTKEDARSRYLGTVGSRSLDNDFSLYDYSVKGVLVGQPAILPRPSTRMVWVYVEVQTPDGYGPMTPVPFGPFPEDELEVQCTVEVPAWVVPGAHSEEGDLAGFVDDRSCDVRLRVVSSVTGEPLEEAELMINIDGKWIPGFDSDRDGIIATDLVNDVCDYKVVHAEYRPVDLGKLRLTRGGSVDLGEVALTPLNPVHGQLLDHTGAPLREERWLWWIDPELGQRWKETAEDGSFLLGASDDGPAFVNVRHPDGPRHMGARCQLVPDGPSGRVTCRVPRSSPVRFEVSGLPLAARASSAPVFLERDDGVRQKVWNAGQKDGKALYREMLAPGRYTLHGGWIVDFPPHPVEVPADGEPIVIQIAGRESME